jgi:guanine deaminase
MKLDRIRGAGLRVGLGSDVAAGPELNLWQVMRSAVEAQKARAFYEEGIAPLSPAGALHLATQGAAEALGKGAVIGSLEIGREADLTLMDITALLPRTGTGSGARHDLGAEDILSLCVYRGGPQAVLETVVRGRSVYRAVSERGLF